MRLGKKERLAAKARQSIINANVLNMKAIREEARLTSIRSSASVATLKGRTHVGYHDNLHAKARTKPNAGSCRVEAKR